MDLTNEALEFPQFTYAVGKGLLRAILTDPDVLCLVVSGWLIGSHSSRLRGLGLALGSWVIAHRADQYVGVLARVIRESNSQRGTDV